jgi:hypothetical protein
VRAARTGARALLRALLAGALALQAAACTSLPAAQPLVDATRQYRSSLAAGGSALEQELEQTSGADTARRFATLWDARVRAADALVAYSKSIAGIAESGNRGADSARQVADSVQSLAGSVGLALEGAAAATAVDTATFVYAQVAAARAARSLAKALAEAQPALERIAAIMSQDLADADAILRSAVKIKETELARRYNVETAYYASLVEERNALYGKARRTTADESRLLELEQLMHATDSWRQPMLSEQAALSAQLQTGRQLIAASRRALDEWTSVNADLAAAVQAGRSVDPAALVAATEQMRELIGRIRAL